MYSPLLPRPGSDLANGNYRVDLACGDAGYVQGPHRVVVQGTLVLTNVNLAANAFATVSNLPVTVTNGQLAVVIGGGGGNTMLNYIDIQTGPEPVVNNSLGATNVTASSAWLNGVLAQDPVAPRRSGASTGGQTTGEGYGQLERTVCLDWHQHGGAAGHQTARK